MANSLMSGLLSLGAALSLLGLCGLYISSVILYRIFFHPLAKFPGPVLGKFTDFYLWTGIVFQNKTLKEYDLLKRYGSPVRVTTNTLVFSDMQSWTDIYGQSSNPCAKDPTFYPALTATGATNVLNAVHRGEHARIRRLLSHSFALRTILQSESLISNKIEEFIEHIFVPASRHGKTIDIFPPVHEHYLDIVSLLSFGKSFESLKENNSERSHDVDQFFAVVPPTSFFPAIKYLPIPSLQRGYRGLERLKQFSRDAVVDFVDTVEKVGKESIGGTFLKNLVVARDEETGSKLSVGELVENAIIFIVAGSGTAAATTLWFIWECGRRAEIGKKLAEEIRNAFPDRSVIPTYDEASKLPYLNATIEEILRLWGPLSVSAPRISPGRRIGEHYIPKGVQVSTLPYATARDAQAFPDPDELRPERWLDASADMRNMSRPFSTGPRNCIGKHLAEVVLVLTLVRLYQLFDISVDPSMSPEKMRLKERGTMEPWDATLLVKCSRPLNETS